MGRGRTKGPERAHIRLTRQPTLGGGTRAAAVDRCVEDVEAARDYEGLVARSDAVKTELAAVAALA